MITIEERKPNKLSGITSLFLSFKYNEKLVSWIKQNLDTYSYDKKTHEWETTIFELSKLLDSLCFVDDITLRLDKHKKREENVASIEQKDLGVKTALYPHQIKAVEYGATHDKWLLLDDQGAGKSLEIISLASYLKRTRGIKHCLVICGINTLKANWKKEIQRHSDLSYRVIGEKISANGNISYATIPERTREVQNGIKEFFIITNVETFRDKKFVQAVNKRDDIDMVVIDELHRCANPSSQQTEGFLKVKAKYKVAATGTIIVNNPLNAYTGLKWIGVDHSTLTNFKREYCVFGGFGGHEIVGYKNLDLLKNEIDSNSLRRMKKDILKDLPPKNVIKEYVSLNDDHRKFYDKVKQGVKDEAMKVDIDRTNILSLTTRLRQATACPSMLTEENIVSSKLQRAVDLAEQLLEGGDKVVIFSTFKEPVYQLQKALEKYNPLIGTGDLKDEEVSRNIDKFQNDGKHRVFIGTFSKCGTGITLTAASNMIMLDTPFTSASTQQAEDRIYRIGTQKTVFIYHLISEHTIDERVDRILEMKSAMSDYLVDNSMSNEAYKLLKDYILDL